MKTIEVREEGLSQPCTDRTVRDVLGRAQGRAQGPPAFLLVPLESRR